MKNVEQNIKLILEKIASEMGVDGAGFKVERPKDQEHGDFSTNIALVLFIQSKVENSILKNPFDLAEKIVQLLNTKYKPEEAVFEKIEAVKPGFINFYLSKQYLTDQISKIIEEGSAYGSLLLGNGRA